MLTNAFSLPYSPSSPSVPPSILTLSLTFLSLPTSVSMDPTDSSEEPYPILGIKEAIQGLTVSERGSLSLSTHAFTLKST